MEVKSTVKNHWTSTGSSILESTRSMDIRRIYMTFGKLASPVEFRSRPYEECLSDIAVTHYPRYRIDMELKKGETIFDKIGMSYDELRVLKNPVEPVSKYYKSRLKPGERLWWANDSIEESVAPTVRLFSTLLREEQEKIRVILYAMFPEILGNSSDKYNNASLFLLTRYGIINPSFRDMFSAGGQVELPLRTGVLVKMPATFGRIQKYKDLIVEVLRETSAETLSENWNAAVYNENRIGQWCELCAAQYARTQNNLGYNIALEVLEKIFTLYMRIEQKFVYVAES